MAEEFLELNNYLASFELERVDYFVEESVDTLVKFTSFFGIKLSKFQMEKPLMVFKGNHLSARVINLNKFSDLIKILKNPDNFFVGYFCLGSKAFSIRFINVKCDYNYKKYFEIPTTNKYKKVKEYLKSND